MSNKTENSKVYTYDTLLRDGAQTQGVDFSLNDKIELIQQLDTIGVDYIEAGFPGANPLDDELFAKIGGGAISLKHSQIVAFGMTHKYGVKAEEDSKMLALANIKTNICCIFGKSWDYHVTDALEITLEQNKEIIASSIIFLRDSGKDVFFDAEHFFDGYKNNRDYALEVLKAAHASGAKWLILCDTNGGSLPHEVYKATKDAIEYLQHTFPNDTINIGIHTHNDTENAVANALEAVRAGARQVQGVLNGYGERCGNANLTSLLAILKLKTDYSISTTAEQLRNLKKVSDSLDDRLNKEHYGQAAFVGNSAFAHKGGLHVSAVKKRPDAYEHTSPENTGNKRVIVISDQSGINTIKLRLEELGIEASGEQLQSILYEVKERENQGYSYDNAVASFEVLVKQKLGLVREFFSVDSFRIIDEKRRNSHGVFVDLAEATVKINVEEESGQIASYNEISDGSGPVDALSKAIKKGLSKHFPNIDDVQLIDYKVRIIRREKGTAAITRVMITSRDKVGNKWHSIGVSDNILSASYNAVEDSLKYFLLQNNS